MLTIRNLEVVSETAYGPQINKFTISGIILLNGTKSLLVRKRHEFHGFKSEIFLFQHFCASTKVTSFLLLYTKGAIFH